MQGRQNAIQRCGWPIPNPTTGRVRISSANCDMPKRNRGAYLSWRAERQTWVIVWYDRGQRRIRGTGTPDRRQADQDLARFLLEQPQKAEHIGPTEPSRRSLADVLERYAREHGGALVGHGPQTLGYNLKALIPFWGKSMVGDVREATCRAYQRYRKGRSPATVARELSVLGAAINHDWRAGRLTAPVATWRPRASDPRDLWLRRDDISRLLRGARKVPSRRHLSTFIMIALYTGARAEAVLSLRWPQVGLDLGILDLNPPGRARTRKSRPVLPIPKRLMIHLRHLRRRGSDTGYLVTYAGRPVKSIKRAFREACEAGAKWCEARAAEPNTCEVEKRALAQSAERLRTATPHALRHTSATWMARSGVPLPIIAAYLGHRTSRTTERVYAHHAPDYLAPAVAALDRPLRA
jgi:integrase